MLPPSQKQPSQVMKQLGDNNWARRRLTMRAAEVAPTMDLSSSSYSSSSSSSFYLDDHDDPSPQFNLPLMAGRRCGQPSGKTLSIITATASIFRSLFPALQSLLLPTCKWLRTPVMATPTPMRPSRRRITGTFFGAKKGRVNFVVQEHSRAEPLLLLELACSTCHLVKEMASGTVRILLECERSVSTATAAAGKKEKMQQQPPRALWDEPLWTMYCNGHRSGYAVSRPCTPADFHVLSTVQAVSVGAGVLPSPPLQPALPSPHPLEMGRQRSFKDEGCLYDGGGGGGGSEVMYMRARFERVMGSRDSEAFYMISPDCAGRKSYDHGGPELSIFLLRI